MLHPISLCIYFSIHSVIQVEYFALVCRTKRPLPFRNERKLFRPYCRLICLGKTGFISAAAAKRRPTGSERRAGEAQCCRPWQPFCFCVLGISADALAGKVCIVEAAQYPQCPPASVVSVAHAALAARRHGGTPCDFQQLARRRAVGCTCRIQLPVCLSPDGVTYPHAIRRVPVILTSLIKVRAQNYHIFTKGHL